MSAVAAANDRYSDRLKDEEDTLGYLIDDFDWNDSIAQDDISDRLFDLAHDPLWIEAQYTQQTAIGAIVRNVVNERALQQERDRIDEGRAGI